MPLIDINDVASIGAIRDVEGHLLPPEAWQIAENMRFTNEGAERLGGRSTAFTTPTVAPHFVLPVSNSTNVYWVYVSLTKAYVFDGSTHTNITRAVGGDYTASNSREWNGTLLGGVPILNNGVDAPQFWTAALNIAVTLANLTNWPANYSARVIRALGPYLIAFDITKSVGPTRYPHLVRWSHPADPGSVPSSWDIANPAVDAGETDLPDVASGIIKDALPLRGRMYIYKEGSTWRMTPIGGQFIFNFDTFLESSGILEARCVCITGDGQRHVVVTQDDIIIHDGNSAESLLFKRFKKYLFNQMDTTNYVNSFIFTHSSQNEVWFCYPQHGSTNPDRALIWNYKDGGISETDVNFRNAAVGSIQGATDAVWSSASGTWETYDGPWSTTIRRKTVLCDTSDTKFLQLDDGPTNNGTAITGTLQRTGLSMVGRKRNGEWIVDYTARKFVHRIWIKATGGPINVRIGFQDLVDGPVTWSTSVSFNPTTADWVDVAGSGQAVSIEFSSSVSFRILGYKPELDVVGTY